MQLTVEFAASDDCFSLLDPLKERRRFPDLTKSLVRCLNPEPRPCFPARRFEVKDIPDDEQECANWLHKLYQEKVKPSLR